MKNRLQLVLDAGGVIVTNLSPGFWQQLAEHGDVPFDRLVAAYKQTTSARLWTGEISEEAFWHWLGEHYPSIAISFAKDALTANLRILPAAGHLSRWSESFDLHLLSNHRSEWLLPLLQNYLPYFTSVQISSNLGCAKPSRDIYWKLAEKLPEGAPVLFVDDHEHNLAQGRAHGWEGLLADEEGKWIEVLEQRI